MTPTPEILNRAVKLTTDLYDVILPVLRPDDERAAAQIVCMLAIDYVHGNMCNTMSLAQHAALAGGRELFKRYILAAAAELAVKGPNNDNQA